MIVKFPLGIRFDAANDDWNDYCQHVLQRICEAKDDDSSITFDGEFLVLRFADLQPAYFAFRGAVLEHEAITHAWSMLLATQGKLYPVVSTSRSPRTGAVTYFLSIGIVGEAGSDGLFRSLSTILTHSHLLRDDVVGYLHALANSLEQAK